MLDVFARRDGDVSRLQRLPSCSERLADRAILERGELPSPGRQLVAAPDKFCAGGQRRLLKPLRAAKPPQPESRTPDEDKTRTTEEFTR